MNRKILLSVITVFLVISVLTVASVDAAPGSPLYPLKELINLVQDILGRVVSLEADTADLSATTGALEATTGDLDTRTGDLETTAGDLESRTGDLEATASDLESRTEDLETATGGIEDCLAIEEVCDGVDQDDCFGMTEADLMQTCGSNVGECHLGLQLCESGAWGPCIGEVAATAEVCDDGLDNDCDGVVDNGCGGCSNNGDCDDELLCTIDECNSGVCTNTIESDFCLIDGICYDNGMTNPADACQYCSFEISPIGWTGAPGTTEIVDDGIDEDCDGNELCYADADDDGYRPDGVTTVVSFDLDCFDSGEAQAIDPIDDCNDSQPSINPGQAEVCGDGIDNNCDSFIDEGC